MLIQAYLVEQDPDVSKLIIYNMEDILPIRFVGLASSEREACQWLRAPSVPWDLLIVDIALRHGSGMGVLKNCATRAPRQKAVVLTPDVTPALTQRCRALGADAVFDKGEDVEKLVQFCLHYSRALDSTMLSPSPFPMPLADNHPFFDSSPRRSAEGRPLRPSPYATPSRPPYSATPFPQG